MEKKNLAGGEFVTFVNSQGIKVRGTLLKLSINQIIFEVYNPYSLVQMSEVLSDLTIVRVEKKIYQGKATVTNTVNTGIILVVYATLYENFWKNNIDVSSREEIEAEINYLFKNFDSEQNIDAEFKTSVIAVRSFLLGLRALFEKLEPDFATAKIDVNAEFLLQNFKLLFEKMYEMCCKLHHSGMSVDQDRFHHYMIFVQDLLHQFFMSSPFPHRAYSKPLGYAGDYEMMRMIQRENAEGPNLFTKFINVFYTNIPIANCVKNRTVQLVKLITKKINEAESRGEEFRSLSIGCGPALEIKKFLNNNNPKIKCHFTLLDFNQETLDFAVNQSLQAAKGKSCEIYGEINSVHELLKRSVSLQKEEEKYDLVYCSGLFDYLSDRICSKLIKLFFTMIKLGGTVLVTNMHSNNKDNKIMEMLLEWNLIYRDEANMSSLVPGLGSQKLFTDETGVNLCLEINK